MTANTTTPVGVSSTAQSTNCSTTSTCPSCDQFVESVGVSEAVCQDCDVEVVANPITLDSRPIYDETDRNRKRTGGRVTHQYADRGVGIGARQDEFDKPWLFPLTTREYRLDYMLGEIRRMSAAFELPNAEREHAGLLCRQVHRDGHVEGRSADGFATACLLVAIRQQTPRQPVSERELLTVSRARQSQLRTARGVLEFELGIEVPPMQPVDFLGQAAGSVKAPWQVHHCAKQLLKARRKDPDAVESFSPRTLAAAALYAGFEIVESESSVTLAALSEACDVAVSTISKRKGHLMNYESTISE